MSQITCFKFILDIFIILPSVGIVMIIITTKCLPLPLIHVLKSFIPFSKTKMDHIAKTILKSAFVIQYFLATLHVIPLISFSSFY